MVFVLDTYSTYIDSDKKQKREQEINVLSIIYIVIYYFIAALNGCFSINAFLSLPLSAIHLHVLLNTEILISRQKHSEYS